MCICYILTYIWDNFWSIAQTWLAWYAIYRAVLIANEQIRLSNKQIDISKYQSILWEMQSTMSNMQIHYNLIEANNRLIIEKKIITNDATKSKDKHIEARKDISEILETIRCIIENIDVLSEDLSRQSSLLKDLKNSL